jgi:hypothetical protein
MFMDMLHQNQNESSFDENEINVYQIIVWYIWIIVYEYDISESLVCLRLSWILFMIMLHQTSESIVW